MLTVRLGSSTMFSPSASDCGRSKWPAKRRILRCTHMGYGNIQELRQEDMADESSGNEQKL